MTNKNLQSVYLFISSILFILIIWWFISLCIETKYLPGPISVLKETYVIVSTGEFFFHFQRTFMRILVGFLIAFGLSFALSVFMGINRYFERIIKPQILIGLTIPALCWSAISIIWFGINDAAAIFSIVILIVPMISINIFQGMKALDIEVIEMARAFNATGYMVIKDIIIPQLSPYLLAGTRYGLALAWKVVVIAEMMGLSNGIGYKISFWFGFFSMKEVLAWTLAFTLIMFIIEYGILYQIEKYLNKWRPKLVF